ncbi:hypothetical protein OA670_02145 [Candidatus Pelagibacter sp.]|nr:hypothetical protein [Candidatus Pelagibacter sp.]|tara:strand:+ start:937 stop:1143 length:207 start_codon:yes stop_codon:yes gene_type:complete
MSLENLNRTSDIKITQIKSKSIRMSPGKVNIDVLKNRVINEKKKKAFQSKIILFSVFLSIGILGYLAG